MTNYLSLRRSRRRRKQSKKGSFIHWNIFARIDNRVRMSDRIYFIYIMTNQHDQVLYTGVTNNIYRRIKQHKSGKGGKFTSRYHLTKLVYYEVFDYIEDAIIREKQIKGGTRQKKIDLVNEMNPDWRDLFEEMQF